jgi:hypothetical protein
MCHCGHKGHKVLLIKSTSLFKSICYDNKFDIKLKGFNNGKKSIAHLEILLSRILYDFFLLRVYLTTLGKSSSSAK